MCTTRSMAAERKASGEPSKSYLRCLAVLAETPRLLDEIASAIPERLWRRRPADGSFALVEHILHLHSIDLEGYRPRIERILVEDEPELADVDGDRLAQERRHLCQDPIAGRVAFAAVRRELVARLAGLGPAERRRAGILQGVGRVSIEQLAEIICQHDRKHLAALRSLRDERCPGA